MVNACVGLGPRSLSAGCAAGISRKKVVEEVRIDAGQTLSENGGDKLVHGSGGISQPRAE